MSKQMTVFEVEKVDPKEYPALIRELAQDPEAEQLTVLLDIMRYAENTEFGKKHHFSEVKSVEDFRKQVPVTEFSAYDDYVQKIIDGEEDILFP